MGAAAVADAAKRLAADLADEECDEGLTILSRLVNDTRMKDVWPRFFRKERVGHKPTSEFLLPARSTSSSIAKALNEKAAEWRNKGNEQQAHAYEFEAKRLIKGKDFPQSTDWSAQELGVQRLLWHAVREAIDIEPTNEKALKLTHQTLIQIAATLRQQADLLEKLKVLGTPDEIREIADEVDDVASGVIPELDSNDPWVIRRRRADKEIRREIRTYVAYLSITTQTIFGADLYL